MADDKASTAAVLGALSRDLNKQGIPHGTRDEIVLLVARQLLNDGEFVVKADAHV